jgi:peptide/nickel transport system substrate-binding protein
MALLAATPADAAGVAEIRVGFSQDAVTLDPARPGNSLTETIVRNMYDGLVTRAPDMRLVPELAESWHLVDPNTYEFRLRPGVHFQDGSPLTADDVKFTIDRVLNGKIGGQVSPRRDLLGPLERVDIIDPRTVRFVMKVPWPLLPVMLPYQEIVSKAFVAKVGDDGLLTQVDGAGPFRLVEWRRGDSITMERDPNYWGGSPDIPPVGPARVERLVFKVMPDNASRVAALLAGDVDIIDALPVAAIRQVNASGVANAVTVNGTRSNYVSINVAKPPFNDVRVRRALNYAVDKKLIITKLLDGNAAELNGVLSPDAFAFKADLPEYAYDPARARSLLAEAGAQHLAPVIDCEASQKEIAEAIAAMLQRVGIAAKVQVWETAVLLPLWRDPKSRAAHDLFLTSWGNATLDPDDIMMPVIRGGGRGNYAGYSNDEVNKLLDAADVEVDPDKRKALYARVQEAVNADAPWVFLWLPKDIYGISRRVHDWQPRPDSKMNLFRASVE